MSERLASASSNLQGTWLEARGSLWLLGTEPRPSGKRYKEADSMEQVILGLTLQSSAGDGLQVRRNVQAGGKGSEKTPYLVGLEVL